MTSRKVKPEAIRARDRRALARAITLVESTRSVDRAEAEWLLTELLGDTGKAVRIGISGAPGVGKSTFIEAFGRHLTSTGKRVAVLAVDPSSQRSGGSILGDKTRMENLARDPEAFIRPSPAGATLGGVARRTRETMLLVEAAGFDVVIVETVGVGQSETAVAEMVDLFVLLVGPGAGDDLQGIKRGVMELADLVLVTKADGDLLKPANRAAADYHAALHLMRSKYPDIAPAVLKVSALENIGIAETWTALAGMHVRLASSRCLSTLRMEQARRWFREEVQAALREEIGSNQAALREARSSEEAVAGGRALAPAAARAVIGALVGRLDAKGRRP